MDFGKVASEIVETVGEEIKSDTKQKLSNIWRTVIIISFIANILTGIALFNAGRNNTALADELVAVGGQLVNIRESYNELERSTSELKRELLEATADLAKLGENNRILERELEEAKQHHKSATATTEQLESVTTDSRKLIEESLRLIEGVGETE